MTTVDPKVTLAALLDLQKVDTEIRRIELRIKEMPALLDRRNERLRQGEGRVTAALARIQELKKQVGLHELEVKTKEAEVLKIQGAQGQSRTNEEFRAFGDHVSRLRKDAREIEDKILECMAKVETIEKELVELKATRDALKKESDTELGQWQKDETGYRTELAQLQAVRAGKAKEISPGPLSTYERVLRVREGKALVTADSRICGGCSMSITANDFTRLHRGNELVSCRSCERILYLAESTAATW